MEKDNKLLLLLDLNQEINTLTDIQSLLKMIVDKAPFIVDCDCASIFFVEPDTQELWSVASSDLSDLEQIRIPKTEGIVGHVVTTAKLLNVPNAYADPRFNNSSDKQHNYKTNNLLCAPIKGKQGNVIGALELINKLEGSFTVNDEQMIELFCDQAATAIENVLLHEELIRSYNALQGAQQQIVKSEKLAAVGRVAAGIAHELNNQLMGLGFADLLKLEFPDNTKIQTYADNILQTRNHMTNILDEIRDFAQNRQANYSKEKIKIKEIIEQVIHFSQLDKDIKLHKVETIYHHSPEIVVNRDKIKQVLINLFRNASHAMGAEEAGLIQVELKQDNIWATLTIIDNGCGMNKTQLEKIWDPFYTTKGEESSGLGLDICRRIIEGHGGSIVCQSTPEQGSTFTIQLPL